MTTLRNPSFAYDPTVRPEYRFDKPGSTVAIEKPPFWEYVAEQVDGTLWASSYHKNDGYELGGGYRKIRAGYAQTVTLKAKQRYLAKAVFAPEIYPLSGNAKDYDPDTVNVYFKLDDTKGGVSRVRLEDKFIDQTVLLVFELDKPGAVKLSFWLDSKWKLEDVKIRVKSITLEEVGQTYGVPVMITPAIPIEDPTPPPPSPPEPEPDTVTIPAAEYARLQASEGAYRTLQAEVLALKTMLSRLSGQLMSDINAHSEALAKSQAPLLHMITTAEELRKTVAQPVGQLEVVNKQTEKTA